MTPQDTQQNPSEVREPMVLLLHKLLIHRLKELGGGEISVPDNTSYSAFQVDEVPDWKDSGFMLSANFSRFIDHLEAKLLEESEIVIPGDNEQKHSDHDKRRSQIECIEPGERAPEELPGESEQRTWLTNDEKWIFLIAVVPHIYPHFYDTVIQWNIPKPGDFPQMGFAKGKDQRGLVPTGETVFFLLAGNDFEKRLEIQRLFHPDHFFARKKILELEELMPGDPLMSGKLILAQDYLDTILFGKVVPPGFSISFPAREIKTRLNWEDLVVSDEVEDNLNNIMSWLHYNDQLMENEDMKNRLKKGYRCLFYGPSGTGKTFTAGLLGKCALKSVYRIDLSMIVSKYIGETEKNLEKLFARAEDKGWILFFDEADALFGKRTNVRDAHDKYANQEVSYLLQRIEDYSGLIILASNMKNNIDQAFMRRFNAVIHFPFPDPGQREKIWSISFPKNVPQRTVPWEEEMLYPGLKPEQEIEIAPIAGRYELTGGSINNIVHYASIKAVERLQRRKKKLRSSRAVAYNEEYNEYIFDDDCYPPNELIIYLVDVLKGIEMELLKEGKPYSPPVV